MDSRQMDSRQMGNNRTDSHRCGIYDTMAEHLLLSTGDSGCRCGMGKIVIKLEILLVYSIKFDSVE